jgi:hypothetical protein
MATKSFVEKVVIEDEREVAKFNEILTQKSSCERIPPATDEEIRKGKEFAKKWLSHR